MYSFGGAQRHGIERIVDTATPVDTDTERVYRITDAKADSPTGAPDELEVTEERSTTRLRVGDPDRTITGRQTYRLDYVLHGHLNALDDHDELFWQATGTRWTVAIEDLDVIVRAPDGIERTRCLAGAPDSTAPCGSARVVDERMASFSHPRVSPGDGVTVVVALAKGTVTVDPPVLRDRFLRLPTWLGYTIAGVLVLGTAGLCALAWNRLGRDRKYVAMPLGLTPAPGQPTLEQPVGLHGEPEPAVAFIPPRGMRPALAGLLVDERVRPLHVSATIVDLAVRGHVLIEELPGAGIGGGRDWQLHRRPPPPDQLAPFEHELLGRLFATGNPVLLSTLRGSFAPHVKHVSTLLAGDGHNAGWFRRRPRVGDDNIGCIVAGIAAAVVVPFVAVSSFGVALVLGWPVFVVAAAVLVSAIIVALTIRALPARTALGRAMWAQVLGFRRYLATAEADQLRDDEVAARFTRYLPYALIFGLAGRWAQVLAQLNRPVEVDWYSGPAYGNALWLGPAMSDFSTTSSSTLGYSPSSSASGSSGFSGSGSVGGGSGGGGGGSW